MMMLKAPLKKNLRENLTGMIVYYSVIFFLLIVLPGLLRLFPRLPLHLNINGGYEFCTLIFMFIVGLSSVKDNLKSSSVFSRSRLTNLVSGTITFAVISLTLAVLDSVCVPLSCLIQPRINMTGLLYRMYNIPQTGAFSGFWIYLVWRWSLYLGLAMFGYLLSSINYRLNRLGRWIFWVGLSALLMVGLPILCDVFPRLCEGLGRLLELLLVKSPWLFDLTMLFGSALSWLFCWLLQRNAPVNRS